MVLALQSPSILRRAAAVRYRVLSRPQTATSIRDSRGIIELTEALGSAEAAIVVWKLRGWLMHNESKNSRRNYRDGRWWTYDSLKNWCDRDFKHLTPRQLGTIMDKLESMTVIIRRQYSTSKRDTTYWYSLNEDVIADLVAGTKGESAIHTDVKRSDENVKRPDTDVKRLNENVEHTTGVLQKQNLQKQNLQKTQPTTSRARLHARTQEPSAVKAVVVESEPTREPEPESGEYSINGEGPQTAPRTAKASSALVKALHKDGSNDHEDISKVPLKVLSPSEVQLIAAMMQPYARLGLTEDYAARLMTIYGEEAVRACHQFVQANWTQFPVGHKSRIFNAPGWMTDELGTRRLNLPPVPYVAPVLEMYDDDLTEAVEVAVSAEACVGASSRAVLAADIAPVLKPESPFADIDHDPAPIMPAFVTPEPDPHPEPVGADVKVTPTLTAAEAWECAYDQMATLLDRSNYNRWLRDAWLKSYAVVDGLGTYTVIVPTAEAAEMLGGRYHRFVHRVLAGLHTAPIVLKFEVLS